MSISRKATSHSPQTPRKKGAGTADIIRKSLSNPETAQRTPPHRPPQPQYSPILPKQREKLIAKEKAVFKEIHAASEHLGVSCMQATEQKPSQKTFHVVVKVIRDGQNYFYKQHNRSLNPLLPELEAAAWSFYHLVAPNKVPEEVNAHFNTEGVYDGISVKGIKGFKSLHDLPLTEEDLSNDEILKGLGIGLALSYIFAEEDLHTGNISKYGDRIDFDMSLYPILGRFKQHSATIHEDNVVELHERFLATRLFDGSIIDWQYRPYNKERYEIDEIDIEAFPDLRIATPFYWVTKSGPVHTDIRQGFARAFPTSTNAFDKVDTDNYKKLTNISTFRRSMFKTFLKFLLIDDEHFTHEAKKHIRPHLKWQDDDGKIRPIYESLANFANQRKQTLERKLVQMDGFSDFIRMHGPSTLEEIVKEFEEANLKQIGDHFKQKKCGLRLFEHDTQASIRTNNSHFHIDTIRNRYNEIYYKTTNHIHNAMQQNDTNMFLALLKLTLMQDKQFTDVAKGYFHMYQNTIQKHPELSEIAKSISYRVKTTDKMTLRQTLTTIAAFKKFIENQGNEVIGKITSEIDGNDQSIKLEYDSICKETLNITSSPRLI